MRMLWRGLPAPRTSSRDTATAPAWRASMATWATSCIGRTASTKRMERYRRAYASLIEIGEPRDVATALQNMATCQISMNDFRQALDTYERTRSYCVEHDLPLLVAVADYNIAYLYYLRGEYTRASSSTARRASTAACSATPIARRSAISTSPKCMSS